MFNKLRNIINSKKILYIFLVLVSIYFITFPSLIFWDSGHYMSYVSILEGNAPWSSWDIVRGPTFPLLIYISNIIFGKTAIGLLITQLLFYLILFIVTYLILNIILKDIKNKYFKTGIYIACSLFLTLDPIIFGYMHSLLTEFVAIPLALLMCYLAWKWIDIDFIKNKVKYIIYALLFPISIIICWFLKQPYVSLALFPLLIAFIISIFYDKSWKNTLCRLGVVLFSVLTLIGSIKVWNIFIEHRGVDVNTSRNVTVSFGNSLIDALGNYRLENELTSEIIKNSKLTNKDKKLINNDFSNYSIVNLYNGKKIVSSYVLKSNNGNISTVNASLFIFKQLFTNFSSVADSYISNYLAIANIYPKTTDDMVHYTVKKEFDFSYCHENCAIAIGIKDDRSNIAYMLEESRIRVNDYEQYNNAPRLFKNVLKVTSIPSQWLFRVIMLSLPISFIIGLVFFFAFKNVDKKLLSLQVILASYSLLHYLAYVGTGANIDRYASSVYYTGILSILLIIIIIINKIRNSR